MTSAVTEEFAVLCNTKQFLGAAFTPRHQGAGERQHIAVMQSWLILIHHICRTFPQNWDVLAPAIEYLQDTEIGACGFSPHELQTGYALLQEPDATLAPFMVPRGLPETDIISRLFNNFRELHGQFVRHREAELESSADYANRNRHFKNFQEGEVVYRRMPGKARAPKHLLVPPSAGPYVVMGQGTFSSVKLKDPATGKYVEDGADIPLDQIHWRSA